MWKVFDNCRRSSAPILIALAMCLAARAVEAQDLVESYGNWHVMYESMTLLDPEQAGIVGYSDEGGMAFIMISHNVSTDEWLVAVNFDGELGYTQSSIGEVHSEPVLFRTDTYGRNLTLRAGR